MVQERSDDVIPEERVDEMLSKYPLADPIEFAPLVMPAPSAGRGKDIALVSIMANRRNESAASSAARIANHVQQQRQAQAAHNKAQQQQAKNASEILLTLYL